ncbi:Protein of unknown function [Gryllus bimaculatus]|nr:Protein of unknown function [Gryllus bimaculatus]
MVTKNVISSLYYVYNIFIHSSSSNKNGIEFEMAKFYHWITFNMMVPLFVDILETFSFITMRRRIGNSSTLQSTVVEFFFYKWKHILRLSVPDQIVYL